MSGHIVDAHLMFIKSMHEHTLAGLKHRERGKETERATFPSEQSIFQNKVLTVFSWKGAALWSQALSTQLYSPAFAGFQ